MLSSLMHFESSKHAWNKVSRGKQLKEENLNHLEELAKWLEDSSMAKY